MRNSVLFVVMAFWLISCEMDDVAIVPEPSSKTLDNGSYLIQIANTTTGDTTTLEGEFVDTNWDKEKGFIFLNTDESLNCVGGCPCLNGPIGTVTMNIGNVIYNKDSKPFAVIASIAVSKTDVVCGTAEQLNAQLFEAQGHIVGELVDVEIGGNFIAARFTEIPVDLVLLNSAQQPESAKVSGLFVALDR